MADVSTVMNLIVPKYGKLLDKLRENILRILSFVP
jgi:hypothetical protein